MPSSAVAFNDMNPSPRVRVDIDDSDLDPACVSVVVVQTSRWGEFDVNNTPRSVAGGMVIEDYTAPGGVPIVYRVRQYDALGADLGLALSLNAELSWDSNTVIVSDPLAPGSAVAAEATIDFAESLNRPRAVSVYQAGSRSFAMSGLVRGFVDVPLRCFTSSEDQREAFLLLLEQPVLLFRTMPSLRLPGSFYATVSAPMIPWDSQDGGDTDEWNISATQLTRPSIDVIVPVYSYDLFKAYLDAKYPPFGTYDDAAAEWSTYISAIRNPPPLV